MFSYVNYPLPAEARFSWTTEAGEPHDATVEIPQVSAGQLQDSIFCIVITPDGSLRGQCLSQDDYEDHKHHDVARAEQPAYVVGTRNATGQTLDNVKVFFGPYEAGGKLTLERPGYYGASGRYFTHGLPYPVPDTARVEWTTPDGVRHEQDVELKSQLPDNLNGVCLYFIIDKENQAHVAMRPWETRESWRNQDLDELLRE